MDEMLIEFNIENFRSIKEEVTLSMVATKDDSLENNLIETDVLKTDPLLKSAVIYGANASGKTNVLLALDLLKGLVIDSHKSQRGDKIPFSPFKLDETYRTRPTKMSITFIKGGVKCVYGLSFNREKIINEYLYHYPKNYKKIIFERNNTDDFKFITDEKTQEFISKRTLPNVLYLSKATQENYEIISSVFDWFKDDLQVIRPTDHPGLIYHTAEMLKDDSTKKLILKALVEADVGIDDVSADIEIFKLDDLLEEDIPEDVPIETREIIEGLKGTREKIDKLRKEVIEKIEKIDKAEPPLKDKIMAEMETTKINTLHKGVIFDFEEEESDGTKRMFSLIGPWIDALKKGRILVVDELDTKLHHKLNVFLIDLFHDPTQNKNNSQLIFTTHNTNLLDILDIFRRDQIWFTEKNYETGATDLYSLVEYKPRKDKNIQRGYLAGKYGALPFVKESRVFEDE